MVSGHSSASRETGPTGLFDGPGRKPLTNGARLLPCLVLVPFRKKALLVIRRVEESAVRPPAPRRGPGALLPTQPLRVHPAGNDRISPDEVLPRVPPAHR